MHAPSVYISLNRSTKQTHEPETSSKHASYTHRYTQAKKPEKSFEMGENSYYTIISPTRKRRRVLTEIQNIDEPIYPEKTQRKSVAFDLVRIPASLKEPETKKPTISESLRPAKLVDMNHKGSGIPTLKKNERFERFLTINESLNRKSTVYGLGSDLSGSSYEWAEPKQSNSKAAVEKLTRESKTLDQKLVEARRKLSFTQEESNELRKLHRALQNERQILQSAVEEQESKFEFFSGQVTTRVELMERDIQLQIQEYENKARSSYNDVRFEVKAELEQALKSEDEETAAELKALEQKKRDLEVKLKETREANESKIAEAKAKRAAEIEAVSAEIDEKVSIAERRLQELQVEADQIDQENQELDGTITQQKMSDQQKKEQISALERALQQYVLQMASLEEKIDTETESLRRYEAEDQVWREKEAVARKACLEEKTKYDSYSCTRRRLEHAISKMSGKHRVLVRVKERNGTCLSNRDYGFDKVSAYDSDPEYSRNWELLIQEALSGTSVSLLFLGSAQHNMSQQIKDIYTFLQQGSESVRQYGWEHTFYYQRVFVDSQNTVCDCLNSSSEVGFHNSKVTSQKMLVKNPTEIASTLHNMNELPGAYIHVFTIEGANLQESETIQGTVLVVDISQLPQHAQAQLLASNHKAGHVGALLAQIAVDHTSMDICAVDDPTETEILERLAR